MNVTKAIQDYVNKAVGNVPGMKVLLLDKDTIGIVSMAFSQTAMLQKEVYLFERVESKSRETMAHLNCIALLRPTEENIRHLEDELRLPKYGSYHLVFTSNVKTNFLEDLARADENEVVQELVEYFADYYPINADVFSLNVEGVFHPQQQLWRSVYSKRIAEGIAACLLSLKKKAVIRYQSQSELCVDVATELTRTMEREKELFEFRASDVPPVLLLLDRRDDPVTPLLTQWTYQAMVHELIGIKNNRVDLSKSAAVPKDQKEVVLSAEQDTFYQENLYNNFGDLGASIKDLVDQYQAKSSTQNKSNIKSIADMKKFVEDYPEFRKLASNVSKHVTLVSELSRIVDERQLMIVSEAEQLLACKHDHSNAKSIVQQVLSNPRISAEDKRRVNLLYSLRYEDHASTFTDSLQEQSITPMVKEMTAYAGRAVRGGDVFSNKNLLAIARKSVRRGLQGASNIYTEHKPYLSDQLGELLKNKLPEALYPYVASPAAPLRSPPHDIIVFIIGGITYEEALVVQELNKNTQGGATRIVLGGNFVHNSRSFLEAVANLPKNV